MSNYVNVYTINFIEFSIRVAISSTARSNGDGAETKTGVVTAAKNERKTARRWTKEEGNRFHSGKSPRPVWFFAVHFF